mgnify:CR=1 FL=1
MNRRHLLTGFVVSALCACSTAVPTETPGVTQRSRYVLEYDGPDAKAELLYRWASTQIGSEWLVLKISLSGARRVVPEVERSAVRVRTPDGRELPIIEQKEFREIFQRLRIALDTMDAWGPPVGRLDHDLAPCTEWFLAPPNSFADRSVLQLYPNQWCNGPLVFRVPGGVQSGRWVLMIDLEESRVRIPFILGE